MGINSRVRKIGSLGTAVVAGLTTKRLEGHPEKQPGEQSTLQASLEEQTDGPQKMGRGLHGMQAQEASAMVSRMEDR